MDEMRKGAALLTGNVVVSADMGHVHAVAGRAATHDALVNTATGVAMRFNGRFLVRNDVVGP